MTRPLFALYNIILALLISFSTTNCANKNANFSLYEQELELVDSVRKAYQLAPGDSSISDFFMKEVRYRKFGVSIYRLEDDSNRNFLFGVLKNDVSVRIFPLIDDRLMEQRTMAAADTNQLDAFLKEVLRMNGKTTFNWFEQHQFISEKILLPILDLHEIHVGVAEKTLEKLKADTSKIMFKGKDCRPEYIRTYEYILQQQQQNAPKFFYKHPRFDEGLIYELDFANKNGDFKVRYLNEKCFFNNMF